MKTVSVVDILKQRLCFYFFSVLYRTVLDPIGRSGIEKMEARVGIEPAYTELQSAA